MISDTLHQVVFKLGWDTRRRNLDVARVLRPLLLNGQTLLDAGCGEYGLADFVGAANVIGMDINYPTHQGKNQAFVQASITSLPFANQSFEVVASVDVLEHLPLEARDKAIAELVRVAQSAVVLAFPCGQQAQETDQDFREKLVKLNKAQPDWLVEHLQNPYPSVESVLSKIKEEARKYHCKTDVIVSYSEHIKVSQVIRWAAAQSGILFVGLNLLAGLFTSLIPQPSGDSSYRAIVVVKFQESI